MPDPISLSLLAFGAAALGNLATSLVSDLAKTEIYKQFEQRLGSSGIIDAAFRLTNGQKAFSQALADRGTAVPPAPAVTPLPIAAAPPPAAETEAAALTDLAEALSARAEDMTGPAADELRRAAETASGLGRVLAWFVEDDATKPIPATRWLTPDGRFRAWTEHPWFVDFDPATPWGRFLIVGLAASWNFSRPFERGEGFILHVADHFPAGPGGTVPQALADALHAFRAGVLTGIGTGEGEVARRYALAERLSLLSATKLIELKRYERIVGMLEIGEEQRRLPTSALAAINAGSVRRVREIIGLPALQMVDALVVGDPPSPTHYLEYWMALAALWDAFERLDPYFRPGRSLSPLEVAELIGHFRALVAPPLTKATDEAVVIKSKLPLILREFRARGAIQVDPVFCSTPDSHVRRALRQIRPEHFNNVRGNPGLSREGVRAMELYLDTRWGQGILPRLRETPVNGTYYEVVLASALAHELTPAEPFLYDIPYFLFDMLVGAEAETVTPGRRRGRPPKESTVPAGTAAPAGVPGS